MPGVVEVEDEADQSPFVILSPRITGGIVAPFFFLSSVSICYCYVDLTQLHLQCCRLFTVALLPQFLGSAFISMALADDARDDDISVGSWAIGTTPMCRQQTTDRRLTKQ
jgi:hypothetical protein